MRGDVMRALLISVAVLGCSVLAAPGAQARVGDLDRSFHGDGRLAIPAARDAIRDRLEVTRVPSIPMASAPGPMGELVIANNRRVLRYRADGRPQRRFGGNGRAPIPTPTGMSFELAALAVDSRGRVLVAGTTEPTEATGGSQNARVSVYRFKPNGNLDRSFGEGGVAGAALGAMEASGLAVDSRDRPVLSAFSALTPSACNTKVVYLNTTTIARFTTGGALDPAFGGDGTFTDPLEDPYLPRLSANGNVVYVSTPEARCANFDGHSQGGAPVASILSPGGGLLSRFPVSPVSPFIPRVNSLVVDRRNRIVLLETAAPPEGGGIQQWVRRFLPDGTPDPEFGPPLWSEPGVAPAPNLAGRHFTALATDRRNRVILVGSAPRRESPWLVSTGFVAVRFNAAGKQQSGFGFNGVAKARFGRRAGARPTHVHVDSRGRIVVGGTIGAPWLPTGYGLAFARFLSGGR